jgi:hypothetical protein
MSTSTLDPDDDDADDPDDDAEEAMLAGDRRAQRPGRARGAHA